MSFAIRKAQIPEDREVMLQFLERNLPYLDHRARFDWAYISNPVRSPWTWLACDERTGDITGVASVFPKVMWVGLDPMLCGQVADFAVDSSFRSLGLALAIQKETLKLVSDGLVAICYDCPPHERGMAPLRRLGLGVACQMGRFSRMLRANTWFERRLRVGRSLSAVLAAIPNQLLRPVPAKGTVSNAEVLRFTELFGQEFSQFDEALARPGVIRGRRAAKELNWRYREDPLHHYETFVARRGVSLEGFVVYEISGHHAVIHDLLASSRDVALHLLHATLASLDRADVATVTHVVPVIGQQSEVARAAGFSFRGEAERVVASSQPEIVPPSGSPMEWSLCWTDVTA